MSDASSRAAAEPVVESPTPVAHPSAPVYQFTPECQALLEIAGLSTAVVIEAFESREDAMVVPSVPAHLYAFRWLESGDCVFTSGELVRMEWRVDRSVPAEILIRMALRLPRNLPAGPIAPGMLPDVIWTRIADSFGVPLTCHKKAAAYTRYTGRWDGKPARFESAPGDTIMLDGGFERSRDNVKYAWALSMEKYRTWLASDAANSAVDSAAAAASATAPRIVFGRMAPAKLNRQIVLRADIGEASVRLLCSRCSIVEIDDPPFFHPAMKCLHVFGAELIEDAEHQPSQLAGKEYVIPVHFVTDIRPGANTFITGEAAPQRSAVLPNDYRPGNRMSTKMLESLLGEFTAK